MENKMKTEEKKFTALETIDAIKVYIYAATIGQAVIDAFEEALKEDNPVLYEKWIKEKKKEVKKKWKMSGSKRA